MMRPGRWFLLILLAIPLVACALQADLPAEPPQGLGSAWFHDDCAPCAGTVVYLTCDTLYTNWEGFSYPFP